MRKKITGIAVVAVVAVVAMLNIYTGENKLTFSNLALDNIEALASGEDYGDHLIANCKWSYEDFCEFDFEGQTWSNSNMIKK